MKIKNQKRYYKILKKNWERKKFYAKSLKQLKLIKWLCKENFMKFKIFTCLKSRMILNKKVKYNIKMMMRILRKIKKIKVKVRKNYLKKNEYLILHIIIYLNIII